MGSMNLARQRATMTSLVAEAQANPDNDSPAMGEIVRRYRPLTHAQARRIVRETHLHDDLAAAGEEEIVKVVRRHDLERPGFGSYLRQSTFRAAQRRCAQITRVDRAVSYEPITGVEQAGRHVGSIAVVDAPDHAVSPWGTGATHTAVTSLPPKWQRILKMRYVDDLSNEEIGHREGGVSASAISQTLGRAHDRLRSILQEP